jgi:hypothetical protein
MLKDKYARKLCLGFLQKKKEIECNSNLVNTRYFNRDIGKAN